jgi:hypothetical protein
MEDSSSHPRLSRKNNKRRGRAGINTTSGNPSSQEMKNGPDKNNINKRRANEDRDPEQGKKDKYTTDQRVA